jgi:hypothetical protein
MESPLAILSRRRSGTGEPFLSRELVAVADRFREDLLVAQKEEASPPDWAGFLARLPGAPPPAAPPRRRSGAARARPRIERALIDLGPGLADVAVWTCGFHEGLEQVEKRLNWSARSGKVVLRIALERLQQHYRSVEVREGLVRP